MLEQAVRTLVREEVKSALQEITGKGNEVVDELVSLAEVQKRTGLHPDTIRRRYLRTKRIAQFGERRLLRVRWPELLRAMEQDGSRAKAGEVDVAGRAAEILAKQAKKGAR